MGSLWKYIVLAVFFAMNVSAAETFAQIRMLAPLQGANLLPGSAFRATLVTPLQSDGRVLMPPGTVVHGVVERGRAVGLGFVRERAWLELGFREYELPDGRKFPLNASLLGIDNAREEVNAKGRVRGILAAGHPYGFVQGLWYAPKPNLVPRSLVGLTGAGGSLWSRYSLGPIGALALLAVRFAAVRLPEPEISLPMGTEMNIAVGSLPDDAPSFEPPPPDQLAISAADQLAKRPFLVSRPNGKLSDDIINVAFIGARQELESAFLAAGWMPAEPLTSRSIARTYRALTSLQGYPTAPVSLLLHESAPPALVFQKSLNTLSKRHHVRIWQAQEWAGEDVWVGSATHDVGLAFDRRGMSFTHRIDTAVDRERSKVVDDLIYAGCSASAAYIDRPEVKQVASGIVTDGRLAILRLLPCVAEEQQPDNTQPRRAKRLPARITRRLTLETRHYLIRANVYYWAFRGLWRKRSNEETFR